MTSASAVDPRLRDRRRAVQRAKERHRLRVVLAVLAVPAVIGAGILVLRSAIFDVDHVRVSGTGHVSVDEVRDAAAVDLGTPLAFVDAGSVAERVERLPWVAGAEVTRRWPGTVLIAVVEHEPAAFVRGPAGEVVLVADGGRVLGEAATPPQGAVEITGVRRLPDPGDVLVPAGAAGIAGDLPDSLAGRVATIDLGEAGVSVRLMLGPEIRLGSLDDIEAKGAAAEAVLARLGDTAVEYIDVSVPAAPVAGTADGGVVPGLDAPVTADPPVDR
ncbi:MAG: FtsQ-type POTRA domain-containing protein [Acidimicrobiia bacterium]|nr:FtsQ-type POTRA domain-containing protein [Acidimicrobiia bacterium]